MIQRHGVADPGPADRDQVAVAGFLLRLRQQGITDRRVLAAFEAVPRRLFVPHEARHDAYAERALPIDCGQTISSPDLVALITASLDVQDDHQVLEIGTGTGYQAAVLSRLAARVCTVDRFRTLVAAAESRFRTLRFANIATVAGDGMAGWPAAGSFDRIVISAAAEKLPPAIIGQLRPGGVLIAPIGPPEGVQILQRIVRQERRYVAAALAEVRFVPLIPGKAAHL